MHSEHVLIATTFQHLKTQNVLYYLSTICWVWPKKKGVQSIILFWVIAIIYLFICSNGCSFKGGGRRSRAKWTPFVWKETSISIIVNGPLWGMQAENIQEICILPCKWKLHSYTHLVTAPISAHKITKCFQCKLGHCTSAKIIPQTSD